MTPGWIVESSNWPVGVFRVLQEEIGIDEQEPIATRMLDPDLRTPQERSPRLSPPSAKDRHRLEENRALSDTNEPTERTRDAIPVEWNWDMDTTTVSLDVWGGQPPFSEVRCQGTLQALLGRPQGKNRSGRCRHRHQVHRL